jgi:hypothetical protein
MYHKLNNVKLSVKVIILFVGLLVMVPGGLLTEASFRMVEYPGKEMGGVPLTFDLNEKLNDLEIIKNNGKLETLKLLNIMILVLF